MVTWLISLKSLYIYTLGAETYANFANIAQIRESLRREKLYIDRFAKVYAREMQKFRKFFRSRKFLLAKVSAPKVMKLIWTSSHILFKKFYIAYGYRNNTVFHSCLDYTGPPTPGGGGGGGGGLGGLQPPPPPPPPTFLQNSEL